jgi:Spy/CpxP family protein refolding chaperone
MRALAAVLFVGSMLVVASLSSAQPPEGGKEKGKGDGKGGKGGFGPGGRGGFGPPPIGQIMPVFVQEQLKLTDAQKKDLEAMQKDVDAKIEKLLTDEQKKALKELKDRGPGGPGGGPGRPGGRGGNPPPPK